jgi:hypothetical protein
MTEVIEKGNEDAYMCDNDDEDFDYVDLDYDVSMKMR